MGETDTRKSQRRVNFLSDIDSAISPILVRKPIVLYSVSDPGNLTISLNAPLLYIFLFILVKGFQIEASSLRKLTGKEPISQNWLIAIKKTDISNSDILEVWFIEFVCWVSINLQGNIVNCRAEFDVGFWWTLSFFTVSSYWNGVLLHLKRIYWLCVSFILILLGFVSSC